MRAQVKEDLNRQVVIKILHTNYNVMHYSCEKEKQVYTIFIDGYIVIFCVFLTVDDITHIDSSKSLITFPKHKLCAFDFRAKPPYLTFRVVFPC